MARLDSVLGRRSARRADAVEAGGSGPDKGPNRPDAAQKSPIRAWIGPKMASLVPQIGFLVKRLMCLNRIYPVLPGDT
jgi:hypothetical protein